MIKFFEALALLGGAVFIIYILTYWVFAFWFRQLSSDIWISILRVSRKPAILIVFFLGIARLLHTIEPEGIDVWVQKLFSAAAVAVGTYAVGQLFKQVVIYYLKIYAEKSEARWDDVFIPIVETLAPIVIWVVGGSFFLQILGFNIAGLWVAIGGASFIIGFAFKDVLANFLSGLVLLVDTPFQFGDVVSLPPKGDRAIIRKIGLRVTHLYVISEHSDMYLPNAVFEKQPIVNLTRPTPHYYDSLKIIALATADPTQVMQILENVVLAHPDTMGPIERKLEVLDRYYGISTPGVRQEEKRKTGLQRLTAEREVNHKLQEVERAFDDLSEKISDFEEAGLDENERKIIRNDFIDICQTIGLVAKSERKGLRGKKWILEEIDPNQFGGDHLIGKVRAWYGYWLKDPDLLREDQVIL
ncbi:MAG: mechanosensitive ion channel family protein, partial [Xenococcus sp. (in: cyanobacteria)]